MKLTLVQPFYSNTWESMSCGYLGAYCKTFYNGELDIKFYHGNFDNDETILAGCLDSDVVAFSCTSPTFAAGLEFAKEIKRQKPNIKIIFGGHHVSALKEKVLDDCMDHLVVGEGEEALLNILNGQTDRIIIGTRINFSAKEVTPWPDRDLIKNHRTIDLCKEMIGLRIASFQANRGCPHLCTFCSERNITGVINKFNPMRSRLVDDVLDEIEEVTDKYKLDKFKFVDATFDWSPRYVIEFCKRKVERNINIEWECMIHVTSASEEMFGWLKNAQCGQVNIGCESGSPKILKAVKKGATVEKIERVFRWAREVGIERRAFFMLGVPEETEEDLRLTESLVDKIEPDFFGITILCPYPGGDYYDYEKHKDIDWANTDEYSNDFWYTEHFTNQELKAWQKYFIDKYKNKLCERLDAGLVL